MNERRGRWKIKDPRSSIMFTIGLVIVVHELLSVWFAGQNIGERPVILGVAVTMMGIPQFLKLDEMKQGRRQGDKEREKEEA